MDFEAHTTGKDLLVKGLADARVTLAQEAHIDRQTLGGAHHLVHIPASRCDSSTVRAVSGTDTTADQSGDTIRETVVSLLWRDEVNVAVDTGCGKNQMFT